MDVDHIGMTLAGFFLQIVTINNLRGKGILTDHEVMEIYDEVLLYLEEEQSVPAAQPDYQEHRHEMIAAARRNIQMQIDRERSYPSRNG